ncbi:MAG: hypothetical protein LBF66_00465 [Holosporales bacterium]|jgi:hypothetical protein|nr:hypothetical protein [Holosporales bacterium]
MKKLRKTVAAAMLMLTAGVGQGTTECCLVNHPQDLTATQRKKLVARISQGQIEGSVCTISTRHPYDSEYVACSLVTSRNIGIAVLKNFKEGGTSTFDDLLSRMLKGNALAAKDKVLWLIRQEQLTADECAAVADGYVDLVGNNVTGDEGRDGVYYWLVGIAAVEHCLRMYEHKVQGKSRAS